MTLKDIIVIAGHPGVFKYLAQSRSNIIVENLLTHKRIAIPSVTAKINMLSEVSIYTADDDMPLREVFLALQNKLDKQVSPYDKKSSDKEVREFFREVVPNFDENRVYNSDIKKILSWYNNLVAAGVTDFSEPKEEGNENTVAE